MAVDEIKLWAMDGSGGATPLPFAQQTESERLLEDTLVSRPEMLMEGLTIVGRQTPTPDGWLDLLGVDEDGRLVVFELKRGSLTRDAVAQVIDYASSLNAMPDQELVNYISLRSGSNGAEKIENFDEWYDAKSGGQGLSALKPVRMVLVGLGADATTHRMAEFLAQGGMDFSLLTFHGYTHDGKTLLARQVQVKPEMVSASNSRTSRPRPPQRELIERVESRIRESGAQWEEGYLVWNAIRQMFREAFGNFRERASRSASDWALYRINFSLRKQNGRMQAAAVQLSPQGLHPWGQCVEVIFFPSAVQLCLAEFTQRRKEIPYVTYPMNDPAKETGVLEIKFLMTSKDDWETYKEKLTAVAKSVYESNDKDLRDGGDE